MLRSLKKNKIHWVFKNVTNRFRASNFPLLLGAPNGPENNTTTLLQNPDGVQQRDCLNAPVVLALYTPFTLFVPHKSGAHCGNLRAVMCKAT